MKLIKRLGRCSNTTKHTSYVDTITEAFTTEQPPFLPTPMEPNIIKHNIKFKNKLSTRKKTDKIILHCTASREGQDWSVEGIHKLHLNNGWSGIGYNFVIYLDGTIHEGRPIDAVGAHCPPYNSTSVGIVYVGGVDSKLKPKDTRTGAQKQAMYELVDWLQSVYPDAQIHCHNEYANKACPSFKLEQFMSEFEQWKQEKY